MTTNAKNEFQLSAAPGEDLSRRLAYLATQDSGSVMTGGFAKAQGVNGADDDGSSKRQGISAMEMLAHQEQIRQEQIARLTSKFDALEHAAREALFDAENNLATILSNANRATDGRAVFKDKDGNIRDEDGQVVDESAVDMSDWDPDRPSWEEKETAVHNRDTAAENLDRVTESRARWENSGHSAADIDQWDIELDDLETAILDAASPSDPSTDQDISPDSEQPQHGHNVHTDNLNQGVSAPVPGQTL